MKEKLLYYLWQQQLINKPAMTTDQQELVVVRAVQRNTNSGPDFLFCYYKAHGIDKTDELISWASSIKPESNSTIRAFSSLGVNAASALYSQALLQLKNRYCDQKKCLSCSFGQEFIQT